MTKKDFFIVMIKLFGLYSSVTTLFSGLPNNILFAMSERVDLLSIIWVTSVIAIVIGLFVLLVFKAEKIVSLLKLDKGFDDDRIEFGNLKSMDVIKIGTFVIGGLMIIHNIPPFLSHALWAFKGEIRGITYSGKDYFNWTISGLNLLIGFLLLNNYDFVAKRLKPKDSED